MYFSASRMLTTWGGGGGGGGGGDRAHSLISRMETRASSLIIFLYF